MTPGAGVARQGWAGRSPVLRSLFRAGAPLTRRTVAGRAAGPGAQLPGRALVPRMRMMSIVEFRDSDVGYLAWVAVRGGG
jgi:hypothetical protein